MLAPAHWVPYPDLAAVLPMGRTASRGKVIVTVSPIRGSERWGLLNMSKWSATSLRRSRIRTIEPKKVISSIRPRRRFIMYPINWTAQRPDLR